jgi:hypothetical protein
MASGMLVLSASTGGSLDASLTVRRMQILKLLN